VVVAFLGLGKVLTVETFAYENKVSHHQQGVTRGHPRADRSDPRLRNLHDKIDS